MAIIGRRPPAAPQPSERARPRPATTTGNNENGRFGRLRGNIRDIISELRKVTWPTPEETRNLTLVVIGITAVIGSALGALDALLQFLYTSVNR
ncbi:MAG TPA: preprotein translocase subunit SecE [Chloroflexia bacterium]|nr:preprotein translocase subunit SecE [Chloroflexia bacterium]